MIFMFDLGAKLKTIKRQVLIWGNESLLYNKAYNIIKNSSKHKNLILDQKNIFIYYRLLWIKIY